VGFCALVGGMAVIALCWLPPLARGIGWLVSQLVVFFNAVIVNLQHYNPPSFQYLKIDAGELLIIYILIAALGVWWIRREKRGILIALPAACVLLLLLSMDQYKALRQQQLVVYSNGRHPSAERIDGQYFSVLVGKASENYNTKAAHTGWHAWKSATPGADAPYLFIHGKTALLLSDTTVNTYTAPFPVDVLVICRPLWQLQVAGVLNTFTPKEIVLAQTPAPHHLQRWKDSCTTRGIRLYNVGEEGAFIME
jgi:competence protein ComEC